MTKMHYKITIFEAYAPYPRLVYWIASCKERMMTCHQTPGPDDYKYVAAWTVPNKFHNKEQIQSKFALCCELHS